MEQRIQERFLSLLEESLERNEHPVALEDEFRCYEEWDSLALLSLLAMLEEEFGMIIPRDNFVKLRTINDLFQYVITHREEHD